MVKSTGCSRRGPGLGFLHLHGNSQLSITLVPREPTVLGEWCFSYFHITMLDDRRKGDLFWFTFKSFQFIISGKDMVELTLSML